MGPELIQGLALIAFMVCLSGFFTGSETALFSLSRLEIAQLKNHPRKGCRTIPELLSRPKELLVSLLVGNEVADILSSSLAATILISQYGPQGKWLAMAAMTVILFIFGDLLPKAAGFRVPQRFGCLTARPLKLFIVVSTPLRFLLIWISEGILRLLGVRIEERENSRLRDEDILQLIEEGAEKGIFQELERHFIFGLMELEETTVASIMTPRTDIFALPLQPVTKELIRKIKRKGFSRIPVYQGDLDNLKGILHVKELLGWQKKSITSLETLLRPAYFVPETMKARQLLAEFQQRRIKMAMVVDEYGVISGLVTLEDVLEELFGEIYDEFDRREDLIEEKAPGVYILSPRLKVADFNRRVGAQLPEEDVETMGGFVLHIFGELPREGLAQEAHGFRFVAERVKGPKILSIRAETLRGNGNVGNTA
ncbi:hemolysin family protein [Thermosulfuriphilus sp.]